MRNLLRSVSLLALLAAALSANADSRVYVLVGTGTGTLSGTPFQGFILRGYGESSEIEHNGSITSLDLRSVDIQILTSTGMPTVTVTDSIELRYVALGAGYLEFDDEGTVSSPVVPPATITALQLNGPYGLTEIGPITGAGVFLSGRPVATTGGPFVLTTATSLRYAALDIKPVPEPATFAALGLGSFALLRRRRK